jgi:hypothetical protein
MEYPIENMQEMQTTLGDIEKEKEHAFPKKLMEIWRRK